MVGNTPQYYFSGKRSQYSSKEELFLKVLGSQKQWNNGYAQNNQKKGNQLKIPNIDLFESKTSL